ncbi:DUF4980 domain-containing protein [Histomonas meleagridis]|uniref:DUF4980 domain-containing protein n=1 Tax=Histomonas meleagridis TaxID=135588 RepID=UPI00355A46DB|nr:DUF4980 domain-containing protein [Histomonas meleagridis]KAH0797186.1 DUF4980 domain-containing protein [Histomonas meleagridis]
MFQIAFAVLCLSASDTVGHAKSFIVNANYINFAIDEKGQQYTTKLYLDDKFEKTLDIRCAINNDSISYELPLDVSKWKGRKLTIVAVGLPDNTSFMERLYESETFQVPYDEQYRSGYHFTPKYGWMNDPNGMFYYNGYYHYHHQANLYAAVWGNMEWAHAISKDLYNWEYLPVSLERDDLGQIFSGSSIVDTKGVSGFGQNAILSFYTSAGDYQQQSMAYSQDGGYTWTKYIGNPIIPNIYSNVPDFRDPKVIEYSPGKFVILIAAGQHIEFWGSDNLINWTHLSDFGEGYGEHSGVWECPDLLYFPEIKKHVILLNINPGGYSGGSACQYFVGTFDGTKFTCEQSPQDVRWVDYGKDAYAIVTFSGDPNNRNIGIAWMNNWQYADKIPSTIFRGYCSIPRLFGLKEVNGKLTLTNLPIEETKSLRLRNNSYENIKIEKGNYTIPEKITELSEISVGVTSNTNNFILRLSNEVEQYVDITLNTATGQYIMDRNHSTSSTFSNDFNSSTYCNVSVQDKYEFTLFIDKSSVEFFSSDGICAITNLIFPDKPLNQIMVISDDNSTVVNVNVWELNKTMNNIDAEVPIPPPANKSGLSKEAIIAISVVAAVVVVGLIIGVVVVLKRKKSYGQLSTSLNVN